MSNPWTKKNPMLSMWMSGANAFWGAARGRATAEAHRQLATLVGEGTRQMIRFWSGGLAVPPQRGGKRKARKRRA